MEHNDGSERGDRFRPAAFLVVALFDGPGGEAGLARASIGGLVAETAKTLAVPDHPPTWVGHHLRVTLLDEAAYRAVDFATAAFTALRDQLDGAGAEVAVGVDFGLIGSSRAVVTHHAPGHEAAARIAEAAGPGELVCTDAVRRLFGPLYPELFAGHPTAGGGDPVTPFRLSPPGFGEIRSALNGYLFGREPQRDPASDGKRVMIVDDHRLIADSLRSLLQKELPGTEVDAFVHPEEALKAFRAGRYRLASLDLSMPGMNGLQLAQHLLRIDPEVALLLFTCHSDPDVFEKFCAAGGFACLEKNGEVGDYIHLVRRAFSPLPALFRHLRSMSRQPGALMRSLADVRNELARVDPGGPGPDDLARAMLRHKMRGVVNEFCNAVRPGLDLAAAAESLSNQMASLRRLIDYAGRAVDSTLVAFVRQYVADLRTRYRALTVRLRIEGVAEQTGGDRDATAVLTLAVCELIDNAITAVNEEGGVSVTIAVLPSTRELRVEVRDTGPGVAAEHRQRLFEAGFSTKGPGRGIGLNLVRQAVRRLGGEVAYIGSRGTTFAVHTPLRLSGPAPGSVQTPASEGGPPKKIARKRVAGRSPFVNPPGGRPMRILFLAANPVTTTPLDLEEELRALEQELRGVRHRDRITLVARHAVRPDDLVRHVRAENPTVIHFSGHGTTKGIALRNDRGGVTLVSGKSLRRFLAGRGVELLVLNACYSKTQAAEVADTVQAAIGTTDAVGDEAARRFAVAFYRAIGEGLSIGEAFRDGGDSVALHDLKDVSWCIGEMDRVLLPPAAQ